MTITVGHLINGRRPVTDAVRTQNVYNPSTGEVSKQVALASKATVEQAIAAAEAAFAGWRATPPMRRARIMFKSPSLSAKNTVKFYTMPRVNYNGALKS